MYILTCFSFFALGTLIILCFIGSEPNTSTGLMTFRLSFIFCLCLSTGTGVQGNTSSSSSLVSTWCLFDFPFWLNDFVAFKLFFLLLAEVKYDRISYSKSLILLTISRPKLYCSMEINQKYIIGVDDLP